MNLLLIVGALIIFTCIFLNKVSSRLGIPVLLLFILLGVLLGWHDEVSIETTKRAGDICTVALTAGIVEVFCHFALGWGWIEGMIMGSVVSSTDAATVFSILRTRKMGLKNNTAPVAVQGDIEIGSFHLSGITATLLVVTFGVAAFSRHNRN